MHSWIPCIPVSLPPLQCVIDNEVTDTQPRPGGQEIVPSAAGPTGGRRGRGRAKMGQQGPVRADLCGLLCGASKRLEVSLSLPESRRRQVLLSRFTALFPSSTI